MPCPLKTMSAPQTVGTDGCCPFPTAAECHVVAATDSHTSHHIAYESLVLLLGTDTMPILLICENNSFPAQGVVVPQIKTQKCIDFQPHALGKNGLCQTIAQKYFLPPPPIVRAASMSGPRVGCHQTKPGGSACLTACLPAVLPACLPACSSPLLEVLCRRHENFFLSSRCLAEGNGVLHK